MNLTIHFRTSLFNNVFFFFAKMNYLLRYRLLNIVFFMNYPFICLFTRIIWPYLLNFPLFRYYRLVMKNEEKD